MSHAIGRRTAVLVALAMVAMAGVTLAQGYLNYPAGSPPSNAPLKIRIMLTDGQTIEMSCASVEVAFAAGGELRVTENGALPMDTNRAPTAREGQILLPTVDMPPPLEAPVVGPISSEPPLPSVSDESANFELNGPSGGLPFVPRLPEDVLEEAAPPRIEGSAGDR